MLRIRLILTSLGCALLVGCPADSESLESSAGSDDTTSGSSGTDDDSATSTSDGSATATSASSLSTTASDDTATSGSTSLTSGETDTATTGQPQCDFEGELIAAGEQSKTPPTDCGIVTLQDDDQAWSDAFDCALEHLMLQEAFIVGFKGQSIDSIVFDGFYGVVGFVYGTGTIHYDTLGGPIMSSRNCDAISPILDCVPVTGTHCLTCVGAGEAVPYDCVP